MKDSTLNFKKKTASKRVLDRIKILRMTMGTFLVKLSIFYKLDLYLQPFIKNRKA
jgi:hypothetical protein